ncbi:MAG: S1 RNA-binding domain-containing protein, partial [Alphaproteobacteria bacterium]|nr:S1 RNA-binding domain-containing protein [Alphaproteobacteria bacterium]
MSKTLLIDTTHRDETRVVVLNRGRIEEFDHESTSRKPLKGNIYLAKVTRVEPSLQAAFVEYGGNRHGFLAFSEIHPDYYRIPVEDREALIAEEQRAAEAERAAEDAADAERASDEMTHGEGAPEATSDEAEDHSDDGAPDHEHEPPHETPHEHEAGATGEDAAAPDRTSAAWGADVADVVPTDSPAFADEANPAFETAPE